MFYIGLGEGPVLPFKAYGVDIRLPLKGLRLAISEFLGFLAC